MLLTEELLLVLAGESVEQTLTLLRGDVMSVARKSSGPYSSGPSMVVHCEAKWLCTQLTEELLPLLVKDAVEHALMLTASAAEATVLRKSSGPCANLPVVVNGGAI